MGTSTGDTLLQDSGQLSYNSVVFSVLFKSEISGEVKQEDASRTTKVCEYTLSAEGICSSVNEGTTSLENNFTFLRVLLEEAGGLLIYHGRGFGTLTVNNPGGGGVRDLAYGPKPELLFFQPLGNGLSAMVKWRCKFTIFEGAPLPNVGTWSTPTRPLQFSYSTSISFDDECYSKVSHKGVLEVPLGKLNVATTTIPAAVADAYRRQWLDMGVDLTKFRVTRREFNESADRRRIDWEYTFEELPPMNLPPGATRARGTFDVQPIREGGGGGRSMVLKGVMWACNLKVSYSIRSDFPRRQAAWLFLQLLQFRMNASANGVFPTGTSVDRQLTEEKRRRLGLVGALPLLADFRFSEQLYLDSKAITFEASWVLFTTFRTILDACGVWRWPASQKASVAAQKMRDIVGWRSVLANNVNVNADVIVDFSAGAPPFGNPSGV